MQPGSSPTVSVFATDVGNPVHLAFSTDGVLYWSDFSGGKLRRIRYTSSNGPPTAQAAANPLTGPLPLTVTFTSTSSDPDNDPIRYHWDFGDGSSSDEPNPVHTYTKLGPFEAVLTVSDTNGGRSTTAPIVIVPDNNAPQPQITAPADGSTVHIGDQTTLQGEAADQEDGMLSGESLRWEVVWHHGTSHTHPLAVGSGNTLTFPMRAPEDLATASTSYAEATLIATDNAGTTSSATIRLYPQIARISVQTQPPGLRVVLDGEVYLTPVTVESVKGWSFNVESFFQTLGNCQGYTLDRWSNGVQNNSYTTPEGDAVLEATFRVTKAHCIFLPFVQRAPF
jgi:PKD repeat protein